MIYGRIRDRFPYVRLDLPGLSGPLSIEFLVDTGFDGALSLPLSMINRLDAVPLDDLRLIRLANGSPGMSDGYEVSLEWGDEIRLVEILTLDNVPLLGMELLNGFHLGIDIIEGGEVEITPL